MMNLPSILTACLFIILRRSLSSPTLDTPTPSPIDRDFQTLNGPPSRSPISHEPIRNYWMSLHLAMDVLAQKSYEGILLNHRFEQYPGSSVRISARQDGQRRYQMFVKHAMWGIDRCSLMLKFETRTERMECGLQLFRSPPGAPGQPVGYIGYSVIHVGVLAPTNAEAGSNSADGTPLVAKRDPSSPRHLGSHGGHTGLSPRQEPVESKLYTRPMTTVQNQTDGIVNTKPAVTVRLVRYRREVTEEVMWSASWGAILWLASKAPRRPRFRGEFKFESEFLLNLIIRPRSGGRLAYTTLTDALTIVPFAMVGEDKFLECDFVVFEDGREVADGEVRNAPLRLRDVG